MKRYRVPEPSWIPEYVYRAAYDYMDMLVEKCIITTTGAYRKKDRLYFNKRSHKTTFFQLDQMCI